MIRAGSSSGLLIALVFATAAAAGELPTPRAPIGPKAMEMLPRDPILQKWQRLAEDRVRIVNVGDQRLFIAYWDGEAAWKQAAIEAGRQMEVSCPKCAGTITVAFHDGKETKRVRVKGGDTYFLGWSDQAAAWVMTSADR